jgi:aspartyl-tRNA(Asn)/glutamyl-tRNA(Gln) amidotransferase subunit A
VAGQPIRVAWVSDAAFGPVDPEITAAAAAQLADLGCELEEATLPFVGKAFEALRDLDRGRLSRQSSE